MIGIVSCPPIINSTCKNSYVYTSYIDWISMSGEQSIIIPYTISESDLRILLNRIQGVVFTGGAIQNKKMHSSKQYNQLINTLFFIYKHAIQENNKGNYYPIFGTCLGHEILLMFATHKENLKESIHSHPKHGTFPFHVDTSSRLGKWFTPSMRAKMKKTPCVTHSHQYGNDITPIPHVRIVSILDTFIGSIEFEEYPFYGVQFHPERPSTNFAVDVSLQFSLFFTHECSKNKNKWVWEHSDFKKNKMVL
jgi:gamma-glutamyl hydrolase